MKLFEIEIGRSYKCDRFGKQHHCIVKEKRDGRIGVVLGTEQPGIRELLWVEPQDIHPL
jgi:hypothetical protein